MTFLTTPTYFQLTSALKKNGHFWWLWHSDLNNAERSKLQYHIQLRSSLLPSNWVMTFSLGISVGKRDTVSFFLPFIPCTLSYFSRVNVKKERIGKKKKRRRRRRCRVIPAQSCSDRIAAVFCHSMMQAVFTEMTIVTPQVYPRCPSIPPNSHSGTSVWGSSWLFSVFNTHGIQWWRQTKSHCL